MLYIYTYIEIKYILLTKFKIIRSHALFRVKILICISFELSQCYAYHILIFHVSTISACKQSSPLNKISFIFPSEVIVILKLHKGINIVELLFHHV